MKKNTKTGLFILAILIAVAVFTSIVTIKSTDSTNPDVINISYGSDGQTAVTKSSGKDYIGAIYIEGTISQLNQTYDQVWLKNTIIKLRDDKKNKAIAIYINSPGGAVYQTDEIYLLLQEYKNVTGRKIYIYQGPMAASGGYYISCAADKIYANRNTLTGSIGVIAGESIDISELLSKYGIKYETIHAGKNKNMGNLNEPLTDEQRQILQSVADECYDQFTQIVSECRNLSIDKVHELADGRIYTANQALNHGLIDKISSWDQMIKDLSVEELNKSDIKVVTFKKQKDKKFMDMLLNKISDIYKQEASAKTGLPQKFLGKIDEKEQFPAFIYEGNF